MTLDSHTPITSPDASLLDEPVQLPDHPLSQIGALDARYYVIRLHGLTPLLPDSLPPATAPTQTRITSFRLPSERKHPHSRSDPTLQLPHLPRNALLLKSLHAAYDAHNSTRTEFPIRQNSATHNALQASPTQAARAHRSSAAVFNPVRPYPMDYDDVEFFPMSSLRIPHDSPTNTPINLTDWFVADCLAAAHTYTKLMDADLRANFNSTVKYHEYAGARRPDFYMGGHGYNLLMESIFYPLDQYTPDTQAFKLTDVINAPDNLPTPLPPRNSWFKLSATLRTPTPEDVGAIGEIKRATEWGQPDHPRTHFATWVDYSLSNPAMPGDEFTRTFSLPYFAASNYSGWLYQYTSQLPTLDEAIYKVDPTVPLAGGHNVAHSLHRTTKFHLTHEAREYARTLSTQRVSTLQQQAKHHPARVVYSDLLCFTTSGRLDLTRPHTSLPLVTRVNLPLQSGSISQPHECVATEQQYVELHQLMGTFTRDQRMAHVADARTRDTVDVTLHGEMLDMSRSKQRQYISSTVSPQAQARAQAPSTDPTTVTRRGRPKGARSVMDYPRFHAAVKALALMADNVLREPSQHMRVTPLNPHDPTDNWTRMTPLMPPAPGSDLDQARFGRGLPVRAGNNQHIDSVLWRSLLNRWLNHPKMRELEQSRPPVLQVMRLRHEPNATSIERESLPEAIKYISNTEFAYATVYIPIPASVMHAWLTEGPTSSEVSRALPKVNYNPGGTHGRYLDPRVNPETGEHERLKFYPEVMLTRDLKSTAANEVPGIKCLPQPGPTTSWLLTKDQIPWEVNLAPMVPTPPAVRALIEE